ncbi:DoxX family protein [Rhodococcus triatomae]
MTDNPRQNPEAEGLGPSMPSRHDAQSGRIPTTDDELGFMPTEQIPTYGGTDSSTSGLHPTEELRTADSYDRDLAATLAASTAPPATVTPTAPPTTPRGTLDLGLLVLRVAVGAVALAHGLQKLLGIWGGPGLDGFESFLADAGFEQAAILALAGAIGEVVAGALLILGLATPFAAAGLLAVLINAWCVRQAADPGLQWFAPDGPELELLLAGVLVAIALTGPGRLSVEGRRRWATRPYVGSFVVLLLGVAGGVCLWIFLNGANPFA